jgi:cobalt/nickel transport system permease protein
MYRYIFVLVDEAMRMEMARKNRHFGGNYLRQIKVYTNMISLLFIRTYERAERVYQSMNARCFTGEIFTLGVFNLKASQLLGLFVFIGVLGGIKIWI